MHRKLHPNQVVPTPEELHNLLVGYYLGETEFREVASVFHTRIIVAEEWTPQELCRIYVELVAILSNLSGEKIRVHRTRTIIWSWRHSIRYRMKKVCPTLFKVVNQFSTPPHMFCEIGTLEECEEYISSHPRKDIQWRIIPCEGTELQYMADHLLQGICLNKF